MNTSRTNVLLGCTGSVASLKVPLLVTELYKRHQTDQVSVKIVATEHSLHFFEPGEIAVKTYTDQDEWTAWKKRSDPVLHIELRRWADLFVIAPLDANTMAKMANGICDNLLTCVVRAWDPEQPLLFAPAMNTYMWEHPLTSKHISTLHSFGYKEIPCIEKELVCGDTGYGAMAEVSTIVDVIEEEMKKLNNS